MGGRTATSAMAAAAAPTSTPTRAPRVILLRTGGSDHRSSPGPPTGSRSDCIPYRGILPRPAPPVRLQVGKQGGLAGGGWTLARGGALAPRRFGRRLRTLALGTGPAF